MTGPRTDSLTQLGRPAALPASPERARLETVANPHPERSYVVRFTCPEFTCLCPITGQPDFAHIMIDYVPRDWIVESKSLKLYLTAFRNQGTFHEACTMAIAERLTGLLDPVWRWALMLSASAMRNLALRPANGSPNSLPPASTATWAGSSAAPNSGRIRGDFGRRRAA